VPEKSHNHKPDQINWHRSISTIRVDSLQEHPVVGEQILGTVEFNQHLFQSFDGINIHMIGGLVESAVRPVRARKSPGH